ncbi:LysR substrate-binding domain-containing protein [Streptomyces sp. NBC_01476]|uniref:LysR substrate-binding domain-containing protein n=1 Tax=Streptomyces sp. NBC_01476 TaxID=2903881 RepID=UPI002E34BA22|nr:LysR substrate-binding domain-containing protein [Streptomyces sp. NBC_01476]
MQPVLRALAAVPDPQAEDVAVPYALAMQALVASGLGVSLMSELVLHAHVFPDLACRPLSNWPLRRTYLLLWPDMLQVAAVAAAVRAIRATAQQVAAAGPAIGHAPQDGG